jgi:2'-5' RNA ligase
MKRLFAALKIHPDITFLDSFQKMRMSLLHEQIKWTDQKNIHITLKFFGETAEYEISRIGQVLKKRAESTLSFDLFLKGLGIFGTKYSPRVIWTGIEPYDELAALMKALDGDLVADGFSSDNQNLVPHLTLGRIKNLKDKILFNRVIEQFNKIQSTPETITEIILFESILSRVGPEYQIIERFALK